MIFLLGSGIALFLCFLLFLKKEKIDADFVLSFWMMFIAIDLFLFHYDETATIFEYFPLIHGPFLYVYITYLIGKAPSKKIYTVLHFVIPIVSYLFHLPFYVLSLQNLIPFYQEVIANHMEIYYVLVYILILFSGSIYIGISLHQLFHYQHDIKERFSYIEKINLNWVILLICGIAIVWLAALIPYDDEWFLKAEAVDIGRDIIEVITGVLVVIFVILIGYFGINQTEIFTKTRWYKEENEKSETVDRYSKSNLTDEVAASIEHRLSDIMVVEKIFLNGDLTLGQLATSLNVNSAYLSQVINERLQTNFCDYINRYRVEEFKSRAIEIIEKKENILSLAFDCGFNSKSSFNGIFKKQTGITPREYIVIQKQ